MTNNKTDNIQAAHKVVVCVNAKAHTTKSGLVLQNTDNKPETGEVITFGTGAKPIAFGIGDTIVFRRYTDNKIVLGATEYNFILFKDVLGVIKKHD